MTEHAILVRGLEKHFPKFHLGPLNLTVPMGAIYALVGPNGAGKTTTIDLMLGIGRPDAGTITILGLDNRKGEVEVKKQLGYVSPDLKYHAWGKVGNAIRFVKQFYPDWDDAYSTQLMQQLRLTGDMRIGTLSFGERVKLALVVALSHHPKLLLLDEPTAGLDAVAKQDVFGELLSMVQDEARTVLISSHNLADVERFADHLGIIKEGKLLLEGPTSDLLERFRLVDITMDNGRARSLAGVRILREDGTRRRLLLDTQETRLETLVQSGGHDPVVAPLSLEDLFVALMR